MKLAYTVCPDLGYTTKIELSASGVNVTASRGDLELTTLLTEEFVRSHFSSRQWTEAINVYLIANWDRRQIAFSSKMSDTYLTKETGFDYVRQRNVQVLGQLYIAFGDTPFKDWWLRVNCSEEQEPISGALEVDCSLEAFHDFAFSIFPGLSVIDTKSIEGGKLITLQLIAAQAALKKSGVRVFAKAASGYLPKTEGFTDADGKVSFKALRLGLDSADLMRPEFGFKWVTNLVSAEV
jgi:hypothetical protein